MTNYFTSSQVGMRGTATDKNILQKKTDIDKNKSELLKKTIIPQPELFDVIKPKQCYIDINNKVSTHAI